MIRLFTLWNSNAGLVQNARDGNLNRVLDLLQRGLDVNDKNEYGDTALVWASNNGHLEVVRALLKVEGVDVNIKDMDGGTALIYACWKGHLDVARALLSHVAVDVNIRDNNGETALILASEKGHLDIICALLKHNGVDVNIQDNDGKTALIVASDMGHLEVVCSLLKHEGVDVNIKDDDGKTALIVASKEGHLEVVRALVNYEVSNVNIMDKYGYTALDFARMKTKDGVARLLEEHMERVKRLEKEKPEGSDITIQQDRNRLLEAMKTSSADPVELSLDYIERCIKKDHKLGSGAYGDVFLAEDSHLPKKFAVKLIRLTLCDQGTIENIRKSLQRELSTLKRFRHPNIIVLYGYNLNVDNVTQCLVYEYAANGSLADFLTDDGRRARLSSDIRLSIMFQLTGAVHFLHAGGCNVAGKGWKVFHRDIKSDNIFLAEDFTPRLIDCGLAKFVQDEDSDVTPEPLTVSLQSNTGGLAFGTRGYLCPEYLMKKNRGLPCPYIAAYDVYAIGVVLVELILGCLNAVQVMRNDTRFHDEYDVFAMYVQDERTYQPIVDGWDKLKGDADPTIIWNPDALELVCKTAIQCMAPLPEDRLSTKDLLNQLRDAILSHTNAGVQHLDAASAVDNRPLCDICNNYRTEIKCSEGHALCTTCITNKLGDDSGCQLFCLIKGCSSQPLQDKDLYGRIPVETYNRYVAKRAERRIETIVFSE